jgi:hypothetical protein
MSRPRREFRADSLALEGRLLLAMAHHNVAPPMVYFEGGDTIQGIKGIQEIYQVVTQQDGEATVTLSGFVAPGAGTLQVVVATDPSSPEVGVNVGVVDQTLTFANGNSSATVTVPILAGAPNPGEVDVTLTATPINPPPNLNFLYRKYELRIFSSAARIPPTIVSTQGTPRGIVLTFSKPMNPVAASNVNNYTVHFTKTFFKTNALLAPIDFLTAPLHPDSPIDSYDINITGRVPLKAAEYDPATNSVTLVSKRKISYSAGINVTQAQPPKVAGRPAQQRNPGPGLTDLEGIPINGLTTPGKFNVFVERGTTPIAS